MDYSLGFNIQAAVWMPSSHSDEAAGQLPARVLSCHYAYHGHPRPNDTSLLVFIAATTAAAPSSTTMDTTCKPFSRCQRYLAPCALKVALTSTIAFLERRRANAHLRALPRLRNSSASPRTASMMRSFLEKVDGFTDTDVSMSRLPLASPIQAPHLR